MNPVRFDNQGNPVMWQDGSNLYIRINGRFEPCNEQGVPLSQMNNGFQQQPQQEFEILEKDYNGAVKVVRNIRGEVFNVGPNGELMPLQQMQQNGAFMGNANNNQMRNGYQQQFQQSESFGVYNHGSNIQQKESTIVPRKYSKTTETPPIPSQQEQQSDENFYVHTEKEVVDVIIDLSKYKPEPGSYFVPLTDDDTEYVDIITREDTKTYKYNIIKKD